jgi:type VI secretion system protein ImpI
MPIEVQIKHPGAGTNRQLRFSQSPVRIGRNQLNEISLDDPFVSEWHGVIRYDERQVSYFDLGSTNGTLLDGVRLAKNLPAPLSESAVLQLGMLEISVILRVDDSAPTDPRRKRKPAGAKTLGWGTTPSPRPPLDAGAPPVTDGPGLDARTRGGVFPSPAEPRSGLVPVPMTPTPPASLSGAGNPLRDDRLGSGIDAAKVIARQARLIEAFTEAFVGLRKGYEQFGTEVGVRTVNGATPLHRARTAPQLMEHLMRPSLDVSAVTRDLIAIFADFGIHHIALMEGITEGVRAMLQSLSPHANDLDAGGRLWTASKIKHQWKQYLERFDRLITDDEELHAAIFSDAFARAYASVTLGDKPGDPRSEDS